MAGLVLGTQALKTYGDCTGLRLNMPSSGFSLDALYLDSPCVITTNTSGTLNSDSLVLDYKDGKHKAGFNLTGDKLSLFTAHGKAVVILKAAKIDDFLAHNDHNTGHIKAPMNGNLIACLVTSGLHVLAGDALMVVEAMKMEHTIVAPKDGVIGEIYFKVGELVDADSQLLELIEKEI